MTNSPESGVAAAFEFELSSMQVPIDEASSSSTKSIVHVEEESPHMLRNITIDDLPPYLEFMRKTPLVKVMIIVRSSMTHI